MNINSRGIYKKHLPIAMTQTLIVLAKVKICCLRLRMVPKKMTMPMKESKA